MIVTATTRLQSSLLTQFSKLENPHASAESLAIKRILVTALPRRAAHQPAENAEPRVFLVPEALPSTESLTRALLTALAVHAMIS